MNRYLAFPWTLAAVTLIWFAAGAGRTACAAAPADPMKLELVAPIKTWDEAVPLGGGLLGGLLWGEDNTIRLSLDRGDLWDERSARGMPWEKFTFANMVRLVREKQNAEITAIFDRNYRDVHPTKIPAGRLEIVLDPAQHVERFELDMASAQGRARFQDGKRLEAFFSAAQPVALVRIPGAEPKSLRLMPPASVKQLDYRAPSDGRDRRAQWFLQEAAEGLRYCACVESQRVGDATLLAITVTSTRDGADPVAIARKRVSAALASGYDAMFKAHAAWWSKFWAQSRVCVPDVDIQRHYDLVQYFYGAASRRGAPPIPLQGVWTADAGSLPPWKGDYHNDLNTQMTYIAYQTAGHFDEGASFLDLMWDLLPKFRTFAREFYGTPGAAVPGVMSLAGQPLGGWPQYSLSPVQGAWIGHLFYLHWRYTMDDRFLRERAYPWCREVGLCLQGLLREENGVLRLPLSSSPEVFDNSLRAWVKPNSNYDIACLRMLFLALAEMAGVCGDQAAAGQWAKTAAGLGEFHVRADHVLKVSADEDLPGSHRHLSNLIGICPFNLTTIDGAARDRAIIDASLRQWDSLGTKAWCGYSFSWMSCLRARVGDGEAAVRNLDIYTKAFILRNGFHANGDQLRAGFSNFTYRPFTLEGNFLAAQAVQEMLLQSWSPTPGNVDTQVIRIFPAVPWRWREASFTDLRAEGGYRVSARRENHATTWLSITAPRDATVRIRDTFLGAAPQWSRGDVKKVGCDFVAPMKAGETLTATLAKPKTPPPAPRGAALGLTIPKALDARQLAGIIHSIDPERIHSDLVALCKSPLPYRTANRTLPGHAKSTLDEADDFLVERLRRLGYSPWKEVVKAQAFGFNASKPRRTAYATPKADAPWYDLYNVYAERRGNIRPEEIILILAHKDSQSWIASPGAYDNGVGTAAILDMARVLAEVPNRRTIRFLWCNEEHRPWTSVTAANNAKARGDKIVAVFNVDSIGGKSQAEIDAGKKPNVTVYTKPEGKRLAQLLERVNREYRIGLEQRIVERSRPGDDDGSFINAGYPAAIGSLGSVPYVDPNYHDFGDTVDKVDMPNVRLASEAILAAVLHVDRDGAP